MRKLLFLILLLPVLSLADCPPKFKKQLIKNFWGNFEEISAEEYSSQNVYHCEEHRCAEIGDPSIMCACENLGGVEYENRAHKEAAELTYKCVGADTIRTHLENDLKQTWINLPHFATEPITPTPTPTPTPKPSITDAKSQCSDIGFKKGTEKFGDCVLELMQ